MLEDQERDVPTFCYLLVYSNFPRFFSWAVIFEVFRASAAPQQRSEVNCRDSRGDWVTRMKALLGPVESPFRAQLNFCKGAESRETFIAHCGFPFLPWIWADEACSCRCVLVSKLFKEQFSPNCNIKTETMCFRWFFYVSCFFHSFKLCHVSLKTGQQPRSNASVVAKFLFVNTFWWKLFIRT